MYILVYVVASSLLSNDKNNFIYYLVIQYEITTYTSTESDPSVGKTGQIFIMLEGDKGSSCQVALHPSTGRAVLKPGCEDLFFTEVIFNPLLILLLLQ